MYKVSFTGYRPSKLGFFSEDDPMCVDLKQRLSRQIEDLYSHGADCFFSGMALGVDMWCAEAVLELKKQHPEVTLTAVIPCRDQDIKWSAADRERYRRIISRCDKVICISETYNKDCMFKRNRALVELCDVLVAVFDGKSGGTKYTVDYAAKLHRKTIVVPPM